MLLFKALRVYQWPKNLVVFAALIFAQQFHLPEQIFKSLVAFACFCAASSAMYLFNDILDRDKDRLHPVKRYRPVASGELSVSAARGLAFGLLGLSGAGALWLGVYFAMSVGVYVGLVMTYSFFLKHQPLLDVMTVALGFVVRAIAGALALNVVVSNWLVVCTLFLALFLALGKRRSELELMEETAMDHRSVLSHYSIAFLDTLIIITAGATLLSYTIYTCAPEVVERLRTDKLYVTTPFVVYGLFRYLYLVHLHRGGGDPSGTLLQDRPLMAVVVLWGLACVAIIQAAASW